MQWLGSDSKCFHIMTFTDPYMIFYPKSLNVLEEALHNDPLSPLYNVMRRILNVSHNDP